MLDIIVIAICAVLCNADTWEDVAEFGRSKYDWLKTFLRLPHGIPAHDTFNRVFARLNPQAFQECFLRWMRAVSEAAGLEQIAIDGKALRHAFDHAGPQSALHLVSAWATANHLTLGQVAVGEKSNESTAIPQLLVLLDLTGAIVTIDAMGCQKEIAAQIREGGGIMSWRSKGTRSGCSRTWRTVAAAIWIPAVQRSNTVGTRPSITGTAAPRRGQCW